MRDPIALLWQPEVGISRPAREKKQQQNHTQQISHSPPPSLAPHTKTRHHRHGSLAFQNHGSTTVARSRSGWPGQKAKSRLAEENPVTDAVRHCRKRGGCNFGARDLEILVRKFFGLAMRHFFINTMRPPSIRSFFFEFSQSSR